MLVSVPPSILLIWFLKNKRRHTIDSLRKHNTLLVMIFWEVICWSGCVSKNKDSSKPFIRERSSIIRNKRNLRRKCCEVSFSHIKYFFCTDELSDYLAIKGLLLSYSWGEDTGGLASSVLFNVVIKPYSSFPLVS